MLKLLVLPLILLIYVKPAIDVRGSLKIIKADTVHFPDETHFSNVRQLTFGGDNAEAYFSFDGKYLIFQKTNKAESIQCDQIWMGKIPDVNEEFKPWLVSTAPVVLPAHFFIPEIS